MHIKADLCTAYGIYMYKQLENDNNRNNIVDNDVYLYNNNVRLFRSFGRTFILLSLHFISFRFVSCRFILYLTSNEF